MPDNKKSFSVRSCGGCVSSQIYTYPHGRTGFYYRITQSKEERPIEKRKTGTKIGIGYAVGLLTVEGATDQKKNGYTIWRCRCECGGEILLDTRALQRRTIQDCGCIIRKMEIGFLKGLEMLNFVKNRA